MQASAQATPLEMLLPYGLGGVALLAIAFWVANRFFGHVVDDSSKWFLRLFRRRVTSNRLLASGALRRYRRAVQANYATHRMGFIQARGSDTGKSLVNIRDVYVPLQAELDGQRRNVYEWIRQQDRVVVVGPPGAGKSMLLKNSMLLWASRDSDGSSRFLPVLVDLHRCNANQDTLETLIEKELLRNQLKRGRDFVQSALDAGVLSLLFDGLDEVGRDDQRRVVQMLKDFATTHSRCQVVVTCRDAHYRGQLETEFAHLVKVTDFDDASIRSFLLKWKGMTPETAERLFTDLQRSQQLMRLAGSPLLLTMIAYLQVEVLGKTKRSLPNSRPAFYDMAIGHLLRRDPDLDRHGSLTLYDPDDKRIVLQRVALSLQEAPADRPDRRSIERGDLITMVRGFLPDLNHPPKEAPEIINEIVQRSQLLVQLDNLSPDNYGSRYAFRHLTLQEYLAAIGLAARPDHLLARYFADPTAWRETVKLWCAASGQDCTEFVAKIFDGDAESRMLALECLAEARLIDDSFARRLITESVQLLPSPGIYEQAIVKAFGAVAADPRPRGEFTFGLLAELAQSQEPGRSAAMKALAATKVPKAATLLAGMDDDGEAREALRSMGEKAIPALRARAEQGRRRDALDDLAVVGTPAAAIALAGFLSRDDDLAKRAAWRLAALIQNPDVEAGLRGSDQQLPSGVQTLSWIWEPFAKGEPPGFVNIVDRISYLLFHGTIADIPDDTRVIDPRFAIPVGIVDNPLPQRPLVPPRKLVIAAGGVQTWLQVEDELDRRVKVGVRVLRLCGLIMDARGVTAFRKRVIGLLPEVVVAKAVKNIFINTDHVRKESWIEVADNSPEPLLLSAINLTLGSVAVLFAFLVGCVRGLGTVFGFWPWGPAWLSWTALGSVAVGVLLVSIFTLADHVDWILHFAARLEVVVDSWVFIGIWASIVLGSVATLAWVSFAGWIGWPSTIVATVTALAVCGVLTLVVTRLKAKAANPLRPLRDLALKAALAGTSIIRDQPPPTTGS